MPARRHARVSQLTLARHLGIGQRMVSRSFTEPHLVNAGMRARILAAAAELGYEPSREARTQPRGRLESVLLVQTSRDGASPMPEKMIAGINDELAQFIQYYSQLVRTQMMLKNVKHLQEFLKN